MLRVAEILYLGVSVLLVCAPSSLARTPENHQVLWQFQRDGGVKLYGETLARKLDDVRIIEGDIVTFTWQEGQLHDLMFTQSEDAFDSCSYQEATRIGPQVPSILGNVTVQPSLGNNYYFDSVSQNCAEGLMKIAVLVFTEDSFVELAPTPPSTVTTQPPTADEPSKTVSWKPNVGSDVGSIVVTQDDVIRFNWEAPLSLALVQVTETGFNACEADEYTITTWTPRVTGANISVSDLAVGSNYFISNGPAHCEDDRMKLKVEVLPGLMLTWITVWTTDVTKQATNPVYMTLMGYRTSDPEDNPWTSPEVQINQRATDVDLEQSETIPINTERVLLEVYVMDVGSISAVRLRRTAGDEWSATRIRIQNRESDAQSVTFECAALTERVDGTLEETQFCIRASELSPGVSSPHASSPANQSSCTCFREFTVIDGRVLVCTSDGCYSTNALGTSGWSDMHEIAHLSGLGTDSRLYGKDAANSTMVSDDTGLTWRASAYEVEIVKPVLNYAFDVRNLTTTPLDEHVMSHENVEWGVTSGGVHLNKDGIWQPHAVWACDCDGACGLKCNQPSPNLI